MKKAERNYTLLPYCAAALLTAAALCAALKLQGWKLVGMFVLLCLASFVGWLVLYVLFLAVSSLFLQTKGGQTSPDLFCHAMVTWVEGLLCALFRVRIHVTGAECLPKEPFFLAGNHRSSFDPLATGWVLRRRRVSFILKPSLRALPVVGPYVHRACFLAIDRNNDRAALKTILEAARLLKNGVVSIGIYPEGTRNTGEGLLPFRNGAFKIAQRAKAPVAVVAAKGTDQIRRNFPWRPTDVYLNFCGVIDAETAADMNTGDLGELVRGWIISAIS